MREVLAAAYYRFVADYLRTEIGRELIDTRLWRVRLRVQSLPGLKAARLRPPLAEPNAGSLMIAVVIAGDEESALILAKMRKRAADSKLVVAAFPAHKRNQQLRCGIALTCVTRHMSWRIILCENSTSINHTRGGFNEYKTIQQHTLPSSRIKTY